MGSASYSLKTFGFVVALAVVCVTSPVLGENKQASEGQTVSGAETSFAPNVSWRPVTRNLEIPQARWDHRPKGREWSRSALRALQSHGRVLLQNVPRDYEDWCPAYPGLTQSQRAAFWVGLLSALSKHESTYRETAVGGGGRWYGLLQILPATARGYKCKARNGEALKSGAANISCAIRILATTVPRDGVISRGMRGVAADWGPFHSRRKRSDMMAWTRALPVCRSREAVRPRARVIPEE